MADIVELVVSEATEEKLAVHGLSLDDALSVLDEDDYRTFRDPKSEGRRYLMGKDRGGRMLTLVIEPVDAAGTCLLVTGWLSSTGEVTMYSRAGGSKYGG